MTAAEKQTRNRVLTVLFIGVLMGALDIAILGPALPAIRQAFGVDDRTLAWMFTSYVLFNLIGTPLMAKLSDDFGRRTVYVLDVILFAVGSIVVASAPSFWVILVGRAVQGFGAGGIFPVASAVIGDTFPQEKQGSALGLIGAVFGLAFLVGPILGGVLLIFGWQWLFLINIPVAIVVIVMSLRVLPAEGAATRAPFDWSGMGLLAVLLASLTYGLNQIDTANFWASLVSMNVWPFLVAVPVLLAGFVAVERRAEAPILRLSLFNARQVKVAGALAAGTGLGEAAIVFVPALLVAAFGVSSSTASFMLMPIVLAMAVGSPTAGRLLDRLGSKLVVIGGTALATVGMLVLGWFGTNLVLYYVSAVLIGLGLSALLGAPLRYIFLNEARDTERAAAQGILTIFTSIGQLMSAAVVGAVAASQGGGVSGYQTAYLVVGGVSLVLVALALALKSRAEELASRPA